MLCDIFWSNSMALSKLRFTRWKKIDHEITFLLHIQLQYWLVVFFIIMIMITDQIVWLFNPSGSEFINQNIPGKLGHYHVCRWPGSYLVNMIRLLIAWLLPSPGHRYPWCWQHRIKGLPCGTIPITCATSILRNDKNNVKSMFIFLTINLA